ncbi:MAG: extracellular solute-binding protein [Oscillospiraceae bacterium]|nr:extracellular solute-binding protein [Oscillospiraceae bacterium]
MKKILALVLVLVLVFALVGCGNKKREIVQVTLSTEDSEAILAAAGITLPDAADAVGANSVIKWYAWYDPFHNYSETEVVNTGFFTFTEKYGGEVEWLECVWDQRYDGLATLVLAGTSPDFFPGDDIDYFPTYAIKGVYQPVDDYIDYDDPLWVGTKNFVDTYLSLAGKRYAMVYELKFDDVCAYNRRVMDEWGFDDPAELYANDEWTWDEFYDMCLDFSDPDEDRYALDGWYYDTSLMEMSGGTTVMYNKETGLYEANLDSPGLERAAELIYNLKKNECIYPVWNKGWVIRNDVEGGGVKEGLCLFYVVGTWGFTAPVEEVNAVWGDITQNEIMFVPLPRDPNGDGNYYIGSKITAFLLVNGAQNPEGVALFAACERFKILDPTVISIDRKQLVEKYYWTEEMLDMYDHCMELSASENTVLNYGHGLGDQLYDIAIEKTMTLGRSGLGAQTWAQVREANQESILFYVDELNANVKEFVDSQG